MKLVLTGHDTMMGLDVYDRSQELAEVQFQSWETNQGAGFSFTPDPYEGRQEPSNTGGEGISSFHAINNLPGNDYSMSVTTKEFRIPSGISAAGLKKCFLI